MLQEENYLHFKVSLLGSMPTFKATCQVYGPADPQPVWSLFHTLPDS